MPLIVVDAAEKRDVERVRIVAMVYFDLDRPAEAWLRDDDPAPDEGPCPGAG